MRAVARLLWRASEATGVSLGRAGPVVFRLMIGARQGRSMNA